MVTWVLTVAASDQSPDPVLIAVKAIDPAVYPFYGATSLYPRRSLADALRPGTVVVSDRVIDQLHVNVGGHIRIGAKEFIIAGVILAEPERTNGILHWGPRCILSRSAFERIAGEPQATPGRIASSFACPAAPVVKNARPRLQSLFPEGRVYDYRDAAAPEVARIELVISFVSLVAFLAFALGAIGVASAVRLSLEQRIETLAIIRILGARSSQMASFFIFETAALLAGGLALGIPLGWGMRLSLLSLVGRYLILTSLQAGIAPLFSKSPLRPRRSWLPCWPRPRTYFAASGPWLFSGGTLPSRRRRERACLGSSPQQWRSRAWLRQ